MTKPASNTRPRTSPRTSRDMARIAKLEAERDAYRAALKTLCRSLRRYDWTYTQYECVNDAHREAESILKQRIS